MDEINYKRVTLQDCIEMYEIKNQEVVINDGQVIGFCKRKENK